LEKLRDCLEKLTPEVTMPEELRQRAEAPLLKMLEQSK
jgi:quinolinate synthase